MTITRVVLGIGAFLCGLRAVGYWLVLQHVDAQSADAAGAAILMSLSALLFVALSAASAYLGDRTRGARAIVLKALFLTGVHGLPCIALFTVASRGAILRMPEPIVLTAVFICFVLVCRTPAASAVEH
jgi:hypothetical protein